MKKERIKRGKSILVITTILAIVLSIGFLVYASQTVKLQISQMPNIDIILTRAQTQVDLTEFEKELKEELVAQNVMSQAEIDSGKVNIQAIDTQTVESQETFSWEQDVSSSIGSVSFNNDGKDVVMRGNSSNPGKNAIWIIPEGSQEQEFNFEYNIDYGDSFNAAGMILRVRKNENGTLEGYMLSFNNSGSFATGSNGSLWHFIYDGNNSVAFRSGTDINLISNISISKSGNLNVKVNDTEIIISGGGLSSEFKYEFKSGESYGEGYGFFSDHYSHGCSNIGSFTLSDINLKTEVVKKFTEVLQAPEWRDGSLRILVDVEDLQNDQFSNEEELTAIIAKLMNSEVYYIGWGTNENKEQMEELIQKNDQKGIFVENSSEEAIQATVEYIKKVIKPNVGNTVIAGEAVKVEITSPQEGVISPTDEFPNGVWKVVHDDKYYKNPQNQYELNNVYTNEVIQEFNNVGKYYIYCEDKLVTEVYAHRRPVASFNMKVTGTQVTLNSNSYDLDIEAETENTLEQEANNGIKIEKWEYKNITNNDSTWTKIDSNSVGQDVIANLDANTEYMIRLTVEDYQGTSATATKYITTGDAILKPIASFKVVDKKISMYKELEIIDESYDPSGMELTYNWSVEKDNKEVYSGSTPLLDFSTTNDEKYGIGTYKIILVVSKTIDGQIINSDKFSQTIEVAEDITPPVIIVAPTTDEKQREDININVNMRDQESGLKSYQYIFTQSTEAVDEDLWPEEIMVDGNEKDEIVTITKDKIDQYLYLHIRATNQDGTVSQEKVSGPYYINPYIINLQIVDEDTGIPVEGGIYTLIGEKENGQLVEIIKSAVADQNGRILIEKAKIKDVSSIKIENEQAANGYELSDYKTIKIDTSDSKIKVDSSESSQDIEMQIQDEEQTLMVKVPTEKRKFNLEITNIDAKTNNYINDSEFVIKENGNEIGKGVTVSGLLNLELPIAGLNTTKEYVIEQTKINSQYINIGSIYLNVTFDNEGNVSKISQKLFAENKYVEIEDNTQAKLIVKNEIISSNNFNIKINVVDYYDNTIPVVDSKYKVKVEGENGLNYTTSSFITDEQGNIQIEGLYGTGLIRLTFVHEEVQNGYKVESVDRYITINIDDRGTITYNSASMQGVFEKVENNTVFVKLTNVKKSETNTIRIKVASEENNTVGLEGINIKIYKIIDNSLVGEGTTDENGYIELNNVKNDGVGEVIYKLEIENDVLGITPIIVVNYQGGKINDAYQLSSIDNVEVSYLEEDDDDYYKHIANVQIGGTLESTYGNNNLTIVQQNKETGAKVEGAQYKIKMSGSESIHTDILSTDNEGKIETQLLTEKNLKLQITQTKAADGYRINTDTKTIVLTKNSKGIYEINSLNNIEKSQVEIDEHGNIFIIDEVSSYNFTEVKLQLAKTDKNSTLSIGGVKFRVTEPTTGYSQEITTNSNGYISLNKDFIATEAKSYIFSITEIESIAPYQILEEAIKVEIRFTKNGEIVTYGGINYLQGNEYISDKLVNYDNQTNNLSVSLKIINEVDTNLTSGILYDLDIEKVNKNGEIVNGSKYNIEIRPYAESSIISNEKLINNDVEINNLAIKEDKTTILLKEINAAIGYGLDSQIKVITLKIDNNGSLVYDEETTSKDLKITITDIKDGEIEKKIVKVTITAEDASEVEQPEQPEKPDLGEDDDIEEKPAEERPEDATVALKVFNKSYGDWTKTYTIHQQARGYHYSWWGGGYWYTYYYNTTGSYKLDSAQKLERIFKDTTEAEKYGFNFITGADITLETRLVTDGVVSNEIYETSKSKGNTEINDKNGTDSIYLYKEYANKTVEITLIQNVPAYNYKRNTTDIKVIVKFDKNGKIVSGEITQGNDTEDFAIGGISAQGIVDNIKYLSYLNRNIYGTESGHEYITGEINEYNSIGQDTIYLGLLNKSLSNPLELSIKMQDRDTNDGLDGEVSAIIMEKVTDDQYKPLDVQTIYVENGIGSLKLNTTYANRTLRIEVLQISNGRRGNIKYLNESTIGTQFEVSFDDDANVKELKQITIPDNVKYEGASNNKVQYLIYNSIIYNFAINLEKLNEENKPLEGVRIQTDSYYIADKNDGSGVKIFTYGSAKTDENGNVKLKIVLPEEGTYKYYGSIIDIVLTEYYVPDNYKAIDGIKIRVFFSDTGEVLDTQIINDYKEGNTVVEKGQAQPSDMEQSLINVKLQNEQVDEKPVIQITNSDSEDDNIKLNGTKYKITVWDEDEYAQNNLAINETVYSSKTNEIGVTKINFENAHALRTIIYRIEEVESANSYQKNNDILVRIKYDKNGKIASKPEILTEQYINVPNVGQVNIVEIEGNPINSTLLKLNIINELKPVFTIKVYRSDSVENKTFNNNVFKVISQVKNGDGTYGEKEEERLSTKMVNSYAEIGFKTKHNSEKVLYTIYEQTGEEYTLRGQIEVTFDEYGNVINEETDGKYITKTTFSKDTNYINTYIATETFRMSIKVESIDTEVDYSLAGYSFDIENSKGEHSNLTLKTDNLGNIIEIVGEVYKDETITYKIKPILNAIDYEPASEIELTVVFDENGKIESCTPVSQENKYDLVTTTKDNDTKANMAIKLYVNPSERSKINISVQDDLDSDKLVQDVIYDIKTETKSNYYLVAPEGEGSTDIGSCQNYRSQTVSYTLEQTSVNEKYMINDNDIQVSVTYDINSDIIDARIIASDGYVSIDMEKTIGTKELTLITKNRKKTVMQVYNVNKEEETEELAGATFKIIQKDKSELYGDTKITNSEGRADLYVGPYYRGEEVTYSITNTSPAFGFDKMSDLEFTLSYDEHGNVIASTIPQSMQEYMSIDILDDESDIDIVITLRSKPLFTVGMSAVDQNTKESLVGGKYEITQVDKTSNKGSVITKNGEIAHASIGNTEPGKTVVYNIVEKQAPLGYKYKNKDKVIGKLQVSYDGEGHIIEKSPVLLEGFEYITIKDTTDKVKEYDVDLEITYEEIEELNIIIENQNILDNTDKIQSTFNGQLTTGKYATTTTDAQTGLGQLEFGKVTSTNSRQTLTISQSQIQGSYSAIANIRMSITFDESGKIKDVSTISGSNYATPNVAYSVDQVGSYTIKITVKNNPVTTMNIINVSDGDDNLKVNSVYELSGTGIDGKVELKLENGQVSNVLESTPKNRTVDYTLRQTSVDRGYTLNKSIIIRVNYDADGKITNVYQVTSSTTADSSVVKSINYDAYQIDLQITNKQKFEIYIDAQEKFNENTKFSGMSINIKEITYSKQSVNVTTDQNGSANVTLGSTKANSYLDYEIRVLSTPNGYDNSIQRDYYTVRVYFGSNGNIINCVSNSDLIEASYGSGLAVEIKVKYIPYLNMKISRINSSTNVPLTGRTLTVTSSALEQGTVRTTTNSLGKAEINTGKITAEQTVRYTISEQSLATDTNFEKLPTIYIDVTYDRLGNIANVVSNDDRYAAINTTGERSIEVTLGTRKVTTVAIINSDYYNHTTNVSAKYEITSDRGEKATVTSTTGVNNIITNLGSVYSGEKVTYVIHQTDGQAGYEILEDQIFTVEYNIDGTISKVDSSNTDRLVIKTINQNNSKTQPNIILQLYSMANIEMKFKVTDKIYNDGVYGIGFKIKNEENGLETTIDAKTDKLGYLTIPVIPSYENKTVTYTITQTNSYGGYNTINPFQLVVAYGNLGTINEQGTYIINSNDAKITSGYSENLYKDSKIRGIQIEVLLETQMGIGIEKTDVYGNKLNGIEYIITQKQGENVQSWKTVTDENGESATYVGQMPKNTMIEYTLTELQAPAGYRKVEDIIVKVYYNSEGRISSYSVENEPANTSIEIATDHILNMSNTNENVHLKFKIVNDNRVTFKIVNQDAGNQKPIINSDFSIIIEGEDGQILSTTAKTDKNGEINLENIDAFGDITIYFNQLSVPSNYSTNSVNSGYLKINKSEKQYKLTYVQSSDNLNYVIDNEVGIITINLKNDNNLVLNIIDIDSETSQIVENGTHIIKAQVGELEQSNEEIINNQENILFEKGPENSKNGVITLNLGNTYNLINKKVIYTIYTPTTPDNTSGKYNSIKEVYVEVEFDEKGEIKNITGLSSRVESATATNQLTMNIVIGFGNIDNYKINIIKETTNGLRINGAVFDINLNVNGTDVKKYNSQTTNVKIMNGITIEEGIIELEKLKYEGQIKLTLTETKAPQGYDDLLNVPMDVNFNLKLNKLGDDDVEIKVTDITANSQNIRVEVNEKTREISIIVTNEPIFKLNINKVDENGNQLVGMNFNMILQEKGDLSQTIDYGTITTKDDGKAQASINANYIDKTILITLTEEKNENFVSTAPITLEIYINSNGKIDSVKLISGNDSTEILNKTESSIDIKVTNKLEEYVKPYEINIIKINENDSNLKIQDVIFQIKVTPEKGIPVYKVVATDENGEINLEGLVGSGNIIIELRELEAPEGYELGETEGYFKYEIRKEDNMLYKVSSNVSEDLLDVDNNNKLIKIKIPNSTQMVGIAINKVDENDISLNIPNTEFRLTSVDTNKQYNATTNNNGIAYFSVPRESSKTSQYILEEINAADGFELDTTKRHISLTFDNSSRITNISETDGLEIIEKNDKYVKYILTNKQKSLDIEPYTIRIINTDETNKSATISGAEFNIRISQSVGAKLLDATKKTDEDGIIQISNINGAGDITISLVNTMAGSGYILNNNNMLVKMHRNETNGKITINGEENVSTLYDEQNNIITIYVGSIAETDKYSLIINVKDEETMDNILNNSAKFNIDINGQKIEANSDENGKIILQGLTIPDISKFNTNIQELQAPNGYNNLEETQILSANVSNIYNKKVIYDAQIVSGNKIQIVEAKDSQIEVNILYSKQDTSEDLLYLTSDIYRVTDNYVERVSSYTTIKDYLSNMKSNGTMKIYDKQGNIIPDTSYIGTGMIIEATKGTEAITKEISVIGDVTGDGEIKALDISKMKQHLIGKQNLEGAYLLSADVNDDGEIKALDISKEKQAIIGKIKL